VGPVTTEPKGEVRYVYVSNNTSALATIQLAMEFTSYITGFIDGEGTFSISFNYRKKLTTRIEVRPSFSVSQHKRNLGILKEIHSYFGVGSIRFSKRDQNYKYEVRSIKDLVSVIIPHFRNFPLKTTKRSDFESFDVICQQILRNHHRNTVSLIKIIDTAYTMNESGKRRYKKDDLLKLIAR
jgi:hypothetical protein